MLTNEQLELQRNYHFWECDNRFRQHYNNHWCKFYGGPMNGMWKNVEDLRYDIHCPFPEKLSGKFILEKDFNINNIIKNLPKTAVYKPFLENFIILENDYIHQIIGYVYMGC